MPPAITPLMKQRQDSDFGAVSSLVSKPPKAHVAVQAPDSGTLELFAGSLVVYSNPCSPRAVWTRVAVIRRILWYMAVS